RRCGQQFDLIGHFVDAAGSFHRHFSISLEIAPVAVAGEVNSSPVDAEHDEVEDAVVWEAFQHFLDRAYRLPRSDTLSAGLYGANVGCHKRHTNGTNAPHAN